MATKCISIALVDDQTLIRHGLKELLISFGEIQVSAEAANGKQLISILSKSASIPDICIISSQAYMLNGNWLVRTLKKKFAKMKILVLASHFEEYAILNLLRENVDGFLLKNSKPSEFKKAVLAIYTKGKYWPKLSKDLLLSLASNTSTSTSIKEVHLQFIELCFEDITYQEMGEKIGVSFRTLESRRDYLFQKFNVNNRTSLVLFAVKNGLIELK